MKKQIILSATILAALCSCTKNETTPIEFEKNTPVAFQALSYSSQTKAGNTPTFTNDDFGIFGYQHSLDWDDANAATSENDKPSLLMNDVKVTYMPSSTTAYSEINGGKVWAPSTVYYWPKSDYLSFAAYSPYGQGEASYSYTDGITFSSFTVNPVPGKKTNQVDLLYSDVASNKTMSNQVEGAHETNPSGVYILFRHSLAQVSISAQFNGTANPGTSASISITGIQLKDIDTKGTGFTAKDKKWTSSTPVTQDFEITEGGLGGSDSTDLVSGYYVMPQTLKAGTQQIVVSYTITTTFSDGTTKTETITGRTVDIKSDSIGSWAPNNRYSYNLFISAISDDPVTFDPAVEAWQDK